MRRTPVIERVGPALALCTCLALAPAARAQDDAPNADDARDVAQEIEREYQAVRAYAERGSTYWSLTGESAFSDDAVDAGARIAVHHFLADDFEIRASLGVWGNFQDRADDATSLNPSIDFRYHFLSTPDYTVYAQFGLGLLLSTEEVPPGGTSFNFTPRAGVGATFPISDDGARLDLGLSWHHISNASTSGTDDNPSRDGLAVYLGVIVPF
jgi:lipid A 3-O-deacylase